MIVYTNKLILLQKHNETALSPLHRIPYNLRFILIIPVFRKHLSRGSCVKSHRYAQIRIAYLSRINDVGLRTKNTNRKVKIDTLPQHRARNASETSGIRELTVCDQERRIEI